MPPIPTIILDGALSVIMGAGILGSLAAGVRADVLGILLAGSLVLCTIGGVTSLWAPRRRTKPA